MANIKFPALREDDYWSEVINEQGVALFQGIYLGYNFKWLTTLTAANGRMKCMIYPMIF